MEGTPVSINREGMAFHGAGTTIYRNITNEIITRSMKNAKIRELDFNVALVVYNGGVDAFKFSFEGYAVDALHMDLPVTTEGKEREVDDVVRVSRNHFIVVGSRELLPLTAVVTHDMEHHTETVSLTCGTKLVLENDDDMWPHVDNLSNSTFALVYENKNELYTRWVTWTGDGNGAKLELKEETLATIRYEYHGVAGMDDNHFIIAATGRQFNVSQSLPSVRACLCTIDNSGAISFGSWVELPFSMSHNFFDMDNMGPNEVIMVFSDADSGGITSVVLKFSREDNMIFFGAQEVLQTGGAVLHENKMDLRVLNHNTFAVFYLDNAINALALVMCDISEADDIVVISPTYIVSRARGFERSEYYFDLCEIGMGDFAIVEFSDSGPEKRVMIHRGDIMARMFGIVNKVKKNTLTIQFAGMFKVPGSRSLTPGRAIYTNSNGELIEGQPYGYVSREFGQFYFESRSDNSIISGNNLIGLAVTKKKIYLKFLLIVCYKCHCNRSDLITK